MHEGQMATDGELLRAARAGDRAAFGRLVDRHKDPLVGYLTRITGRREDAEDVAQEAFVRLFERSARYREQGKLSAYLFRIATNLVRGRERQRARRRLLRAVFLSPNGHGAPDAPGERLLERELKRELARALARLPLRYRVPVVLSSIEGWSYRRIGELTGCREGTVKSRIHRGKRRLEEMLSPYWHGGGAR